MNWRVAWCAAALSLLGSAHPAAAQLVSDRQVEELSGCYEVQIGEWDPSPPEDIALLPARVELLRGIHHASPDAPSGVRAHVLSRPSVLRRARAWNGEGQPIRGFDTWSAINDRAISLRQRIEGPYVLTAWRREEGGGFDGRILTAGRLRLRDLPRQELRSAPLTLRRVDCEA